MFSFFSLPIQVQMGRWLMKPKAYLFSTTLMYIYNAHIIVLIDRNCTQDDQGVMETGKLCHSCYIYYMVNCWYSHLSSDVRGTELDKVKYTHWHCSSLLLTEFSSFFLLSSRGQLASNNKMTIKIHQAGRCSLLLMLVNTLIHGLEALQPLMWLVIHGGSPARAWGCAAASAGLSPATAGCLPALYNKNIHRRIILLLKMSKEVNLYQ